MALGVAGGIGEREDRRDRRDRPVDVDVRRRHDRRRAHRRRRRSSAAWSAGALTPYFVSIGWLEPDEPFRKIGFIIALGMIIGAAIVDMSLILVAARWQRARVRAPRRRPADAAEDWKRTNTAPARRSGSSFWGVGIVIVGSQVLHQPVGYLVIAIAAGVRVRDGQRHLARHHRLEPDLLGVRRHGVPDGGARPAATRSSG